MNKTKVIKLVIDQSTLEEYNIFYFDKYKKRKKKPIEQPTHPSLNKWIIMRRPQMNHLKNQWKEFIVWFVEKNGMKNMMIEKCTMKFISIFKTKIRKDNDNTDPKFILDGFVEAGLIIDDDSLHLTSLTLECGYDKYNPRTEIFISQEL